MRIICTILALLPYYLFAQVCEGSLGDNIFEEGDFGSGPATVIPGDPGIAPGYVYTTSPPPNDGQYTIVNNLAIWPLFPTWLGIQDNSPDPNGYMMVVNASFDTGLFYDQEVDGLCENTLYEFSADIINLIQVGVNGHIKPNVSFLLDDVVQFSTGNIPETNNWETYGFTFTTGPGQSSVRLSLRNNAPGGIGNDLALDNISFRACGNEAFILPEETAILCEDGSPLSLFATVNGTLFADPAIQWQRSPDGVSNWEDIPGANGTSYLHTELRLGFYYYRFQLANGESNLGNVKCRINSNVKLVHVRAKEYFVTDTICTGFTYTVGPSVYTQTGNYTDSLINTYGCDSIVLLDLTVLPQPDIRADFILENSDCFNTTNGQITIQNVQGGFSPYQFTFNGGDPGTTVFYPDLPGDNTYQFTISDRFSCQVDTSVYLPNPQALTLDLGPDQLLDLGDETSVFALTNFPVTRYFWSSTSDELPCTTSGICDELTWFPTQTQTVYLTTEDSNNCTVIDSVRITVNPIKDVYVPNAFSPNLDGVNDHFMVFGPVPRIRNVNRFEVYDRWGNQMFSATNLTPGDTSQGWDGYARGKLASPGVYAYQIEVEFLDGTRELLSGDVLLLR